MSINMDNIAKLPDELIKLIHNFLPIQAIVFTNKQKNKEVKSRVHSSNLMTSLQKIECNGKFMDCFTINCYNPRNYMVFEQRMEANHFAQRTSGNPKREEQTFYSIETFRH